jgi:hypothetical protein
LTYILQIFSGLPKIAPAWVQLVPWALGDSWMAIDVAEAAGYIGYTKKP